MICALLSKFDSSTAIIITKFGITEPEKHGRHDTWISGITEHIFLGSAFQAVDTHCILQIPGSPLAFRM